MKKVARGGGPPEATALNKSKLALSLLALEAGYETKKKKKESIKGRRRRKTETKDTPSRCVAIIDGP